MNILSVFDGIACGKIAAERAGIHIDNYFSSEIDKNAIEIAKANYKDIISLGDVTKHEEWDLPKIDLFIGGSPCQGFSRNGKQLNFEDPRSKLFFEYVKIKDKLLKKNPDMKFLLENVEMKKEYVSVMNEYMGVEARLINSKLLSAQNRPRLYWTNFDYDIPDDLGIRLKDILDDTDTEFVIKNGIAFDTRLNEAQMNMVKLVDGEVRVNQAVKKGYIVAEDGDGINLQFPTSKTRRGRVVKQKSSTLDCQCEVCVFYDGKIRKLSIRELERLQTLPDGYTKTATEKNAKKAIGNGWTVDVIAHILKSI